MKLKKYLLTEERADYSTQHLQDAIRHIRNGIEDIYELFDDIEDRKGMIQANKMKKEWKALEKLTKPFVYNMDRIHQFRDELKNGGKITEPVAKPTDKPIGSPKEEPAKEPIEKAIDKHLTERGPDFEDFFKGRGKDGEELKRIADKYHLVDDMRDVRGSIFEFNEFLAEIKDKQGMAQFKKFLKEWNKLESILQKYTPKFTYKKGDFK